MLLSCVLQTYNGTSRVCLFGHDTMIDVFFQERPKMVCLGVFQMSGVSLSTPQSINVLLANTDPQDHNTYDHVPYIEPRKTVLL